MQAYVASAPRCHLKDVARSAAEGGRRPRWKPPNLHPVGWSCFPSIPGRAPTGESELQRSPDLGIDR
tara:strand:+ start:6712 stop:6912 length:201 start_codon:yes stop_codon:yes gene_type:complete